MACYIDVNIFNSKKVIKNDKMTIERLQEALFSDNAIGPHLIEYLPQSFDDSPQMNIVFTGFGKVFAYRTSLQANWIRNFPVATASMLAFSAVICGVEDSLSTLALINARESKAANQFVILAIGYFGYWGLKFPQLSRKSNKSLSKFCIQGVQFLSSMMIDNNNDNNRFELVENLNQITLLSLLVSCSWSSKEEDMLCASEFKNACGKLLRAYTDTKSIQELWSGVQSLLPPLGEDTINSGNSHTKISSFLTWFGASTTTASSATSNANSNKSSTLLMIACDALESVAAADVQDDDDSNDSDDNDVDEDDDDDDDDDEDEDKDEDEDNEDDDDDDDDEVDLMFQLDTKGDDSILTSIDDTQGDGEDGEDALKSEVDQAIQSNENDDSEEEVSTSRKSKKTKSKSKEKDTHGKRKKKRV